MQCGPCWGRKQKLPVYRSAGRCTGNLDWTPCHAKSGSPPQPWLSRTAGHSGKVEECRPLGSEGGREKKRTIRFSLERFKPHVIPNESGSRDFLWIISPVGMGLGASILLTASFSHRFPDRRRILQQSNLLIRLRSSERFSWPRKGAREGKAHTDSRNSVYCLRSHGRN